MPVTHLPPTSSAASSPLDHAAVTAKIIELELGVAGVPHSRVGRTGVLGIIKGEQPGHHVIALRADIDEAALPIAAALYANYALWWLNSSPSIAKGSETLQAAQ